jgi:glycosyltransferase involved in cell wall biosynthesis
MRDAYGVDASRIRVVPYGLPLEDVMPRSRPDGLPQVTFVGTTIDRKGGARLLRVHRERLAGRCVLNLVTRAPVPAQEGVRVHADFVPGDPRLARLLAETAVFAFPTEMDNSPYSVLEAMRAGCPIVTTHCGALPEMVPDGECGLLVAHDDDALADAILALLDDPAGAQRMGAAAAERVRALYDARVTTRHLVGVLHEARERYAA